MLNNPLQYTDPTGHFADVFVDPKEKDGGDNFGGIEGLEDPVQTALEGSGTASSDETLRNEIEDLLQETDQVIDRIQERLDRLATEGLSFPGFSDRFSLGREFSGEFDVGTEVRAFRGVPAFGEFLENLSTFSGYAAFISLTLGQPEVALIFGTISVVSGGLKIGLFSENKAKDTIVESAKVAIPVPEPYNILTDPVIDVIGDKIHERFKKH